MCGQSHSQHKSEHVPLRFPAQVTHRCSVHLWNVFKEWAAVSFTDRRTQYEERQECQRIWCTHEPSKEKPYVPFIRCKTVDDSTLTHDFKKLQLTNVSDTFGWKKNTKQVLGYISSSKQMEWTCKSMGGRFEKRRIKLLEGLKVRRDTTDFYIDFFHCQNISF